MLATWGTSTGFNPASLFAGGVQGAWYDPSDFPPNWRVNLLTYTEQFDNAAGWTALNATVTANATVAPDGTTTADKLIENTATGVHTVLLSSFLTITSGATYTLSIYAKAAERTILYLRDNGTSAVGVYFDLVNGVITSQEASVVAASITAVGSGWYRCVVTYVAGSTTGNPQPRLVLSGTTQSYTGDGTSGLFIWGIQFEAGSTATAYQQIVTPEISFLQYNPQPVMYGTAGGASPITAVEQAVGLILDKSKGLLIGSDVTTGAWLNGFTTTFDTFTSASASGFTGTTTGAKSPRVKCPATIVTGQWYQVTFTVDVLTNATFAMQLGTTTYGGAAFQATDTISSTGTYTRILGASVASDSLLALVTATGAATVTLSGITVKPLAGNHAYQTTSASRPTLRARYNLLTFSEQFNDASWSTLNAAIVANSTVAPDGTTTADTFNVTDATNAVKRTQQVLSPVPTGANAFSVYVKAGTQNFVQLYCTGDVQAFANFDVSAGTVGTAGTKTTASIQSVGDGWYRCVAVFDATTVYTGATFRIAMQSSASAIYNGTTPNIGTFFLWGAQFVQTAVFPSNVYQRIAAATDYATGAAFPQYLSFDGTDDSLLTANVDFATVTSDGAERRNLLLNPTQFDVSATWVPSNSSATANATTAPDGTTTADKLVENTAAATHFIGQSATTTTTTHTLSVYMKPAGRNWGIVYVAGPNVGAYFDLVNGVVGSSFVGAPTSTNVQSVGDGWFRCSITFTATASVTPRIYTATADGVSSYTGDGTSGIFLWGAQLETGSTATAFQNIGTDKMTVWSGLSKLSDAAAAMVVELSAVLTANNGTFYVIAPTGAAGNNYQYASRGTATTSASGTYVSPITNVVTGQSDIGAPSISLRVNAAVAASNTVTQGTGNYLSYPLYIGRRNNATLPFNGRLYSLIVRGAASDSSQVAQTERYVASKTPLGTV